MTPNSAFDLSIIGAPSMHTSSLHPSPEPFHGESDIVERLRGLQSGDAVDVAARLYDLCQDAAAEIERLRREQIDADMAIGALQAIHELLDSGGVPRGTFADDHVRNLVAMYNQIKAERDTAESLLAAAWENAAKIAEAKALEFLSPEYATGQPFSSFSERFACEQIAAALRAAGKEVSERNSTQKDGSR